MVSVPNPVATFRSVRVLAGAGLIRPLHPQQVLGVGLAVRRYGLTTAAGFGIQAALRPDRAAVIDERGQVTYGQLEERSTTLAAALADLGLKAGDRVGLLCRNHRGMLDATGALAKLGADALYLNTGFAAPQLADVLRREHASAIILDQEFLPLTGAGELPCLVAWVDGDVVSYPTLDGLLAGGRRPGPGRPPREGQQIILTSGTTGEPKGAQRGRTAVLDPLVTLLSMIPLHAEDVTMVAAPMFHSWGLGHMAAGLVLGSTLLLRRRFDPEATLQAIEAHRATVLAAVPVMLQRIMDLPAEVRRRYDTSSLRVVAASGSTLPGDLARQFMDAFGDVLYNLYGSTEVAWASIATPTDLREAPGTAGRPPAGTVVRVVDEHDREVALGQSGRIFVGNSLLFSGYTGGGTKPILDGLMSTGDVGHFDPDGRLFVDGRDDDMIVSGGENVFPREVEDLLAVHPAVAECSVVGVDDPEFGQRLQAFVVVRTGFGLEPAELKDFVGSRLARHKVPRDIQFVHELPRNATGKVLKRDLRGG